MLPKIEATLNRIKQKCGSKYLLEVIIPIATKRVSPGMNDKKPIPVLMKINRNKIR